MSFLARLFWTTVSKRLTNLRSRIEAQFCSVSGVGNSYPHNVRSQKPFNSKAVSNRLFRTICAPSSMPRPRWLRSVFVHVEHAEISSSKEFRRRTELGDT